MRWILAISLICSGCTFSKMSTAILPVNNLKMEFEDARSDTLRLIGCHLNRHPDCDVGFLIERVTNASFLFSYRDDKQLGAYSFPPENVVNMFFNSNADWTRQKRIAYIIHEATHISKKPDGRFVCDADGHPIKGVPVCRLFGEVQYQSKEINDAIRSHLAEELKEFK